MRLCERSARAGAVRKTLKRAGKWPLFLADGTQTMVAIQINHRLVGNDAGAGDQ